MIEYFNNQLFRVSAFFHWLFKLQSVDKIDSPFLFSFYNSVVQDRIHDDKLTDIEDLRNAFLKDQRTFVASDYGAQADRYHNKNRRVRDLARIASSSKRKCEILYAIVSFFKPASILELGTCLGLATLYMRAADSNIPLVTVEGDPAIFKLQDFNKWNWSEDIESVNKSFSDFLRSRDDDDQKFDLVFIDGAHSSKDTLNILSGLSRATHANTVFILDDIYWSTDMIELWQDLKSRDRWNIKIDLWYFGILTNNHSVKSAIDICLPPIHIRWQTGLWR